MSVSKLHAVIKKTPEGKLILLDKDSKYGTFSLIQNTNLELIPYSNLIISYGNKIFDLKIRFECNIFDCLKLLLKRKDYKNKIIENFYQEINKPFVTREKINLIKIETFSEEIGDSSEEDRKENDEPVN